MRVRKTVKIDDKEITVYELRVKDIRQLMDLGADMDADALDGFMPQALKLCCDLPPADLEGMAPSELKQLWEAFREANQVFFDLAVQSGVANQLKTAFREHLTSFAAASSSAATKTSSTTAGGSSKPASRKR